jgi:hypothetical protein
MYLLLLRIGGGVLEGIRALLTMAPAPVRESIHSSAVNRSKALIMVADTPYYHITSRCVRRAFLCGVDHYSGQSYEHRRQWIVDRIRLLSSLFAIDVCAEYCLPPGFYERLEF